MEVFSKSIELYNWCVNTLREAYMNDTLIAGSPCGCDIGNLIHARALEAGCTKVTAYVLASNWARIFNTSNIILSSIPIAQGLCHVVRRKGDLVQTMAKDFDSAAAQALSFVGLPLHVMMNLEWAFETNQMGASTDEKMFNGLLASIEVLDKYFEVGDYAKEETKEKFVQVLNTKTCQQSKESCLVS